MLMIVNKFSLILLLGSLAAIPAAAQTVQQPATNPSSPGLHNASTRHRNNTVRSVEKMPEENYGLRPGPQQEVRNFGQQVGHIANYLWCSQAKGEKNPNRGNNLA